ncbi:MAG: cellulase family glycosylhydrolase, partial [Gaiellaceae bacterium]
MRASFRYVSFVGVIVCAVALAASAGAAARSSSRTFTTGPTRPLRTALVDTSLLDRSNAAAFALTRAAGAEYVLLAAHRSSIAPSDPAADFDPSDPASPGYSWSALDTAVETAEDAGLTPIVDIISTPAWAYAMPPASVNAGTPKVDALGQFARAIATHYDGADGGPVVHIYEVWNEPNLSLELGPANASAYRAMVNAVASSVHAVDSNNLVVAGGLDPFEHRKNSLHGWNSVAPLVFMRSLLCLSKGPHPHATCHDPVHFDVWSHHPYTFGGPFGKSKNPGDVELG